MSAVLAKRRGYLDLLADAAERAQVAVWSYCLMPNHVHIIAVPADPNGLWRTFHRLHRDHTDFINARMRVTGHLWQGRYGSVAMDEAHFVTALRYVAPNPVCARLVERAEEWKWANTRALVDPARSDGITDTAPVLERVPDYAALIRSGEDAALSQALRKSESTGRPLGDSTFLDRVEAMLGRDARPGKRGPKVKVP